MQRLPCFGQVPTSLIEYGFDPPLQSWCRCCSIICKLLNGIWGLAGLWGSLGYMFPWLPTGFCVSGYVQVFLMPLYHQHGPANLLEFPTYDYHPLSSAKRSKKTDCEPGTQEPESYDQLLSTLPYSRTLVLRCFAAFRVELVLREVLWLGIFGGCSTHKRGLKPWL